MQTKGDNKKNNVEKIHSLTHRLRYVIRFSIDLVRFMENCHVR